MEIIGGAATAALDPFYAYAAAAVLGYGCGSIPFGLLLTRAAGLGDIRNIGSGNIGATNVARTGRLDIALATLLLDGGKAAYALVVARAALGPEVGLVAGAAAFVGHCFPVWLGFRGGKGVATFFGALLAGLFPVGVFAALAWLLTAIVFRFSSLAALTAAAASPLLAYAFHGGPWGVGFCAALAVLIFLRHHANIARLIKGEESKISLGRAKAA